MRPIFDGHNDALTREDHAALADGRAGGHLDLPRMRLGGVRGGIFAVFTPSPTARRKPVPRTDGVFEASARPVGSGEGSGTRERRRQGAVARVPG